MRFGWVFVVVAACGNSSTPATTPSGTGTGTGTATATATVTASASAAPAETATASAAPTATTPPPAPMKTLAETLATRQVHHPHVAPQDRHERDQQIDIKTAATIKAIINLVGADQRPGGSGPGYMSTFDFKFFDKDGNPLATISLFASATMSDSNKKYGRINVADETYGGIVVAKYDDLQKKLKALGVELP